MPSGMKGRNEIFEEKIVGGMAEIEKEVHLASITCGSG